MKIFPALTQLALVVVLLVGTPDSVRAHSAAEEMSQAAANFLATLTPEQKDKAAFDFKNEERANWHYIPKARKGLPFKELTPTQSRLAFALLACGLSQRGFVKATTIMSLEDILRELENGKGPTRDPELYYLSLFGKPGGKTTWGWRVEGHHLSLNFTLTGGDKISATPSFLGTNPAEVKEGPRKGLRVLAAEEDLARALVKSLNDEQKKSAIMAATAPKEIITAAERKVKPLETAGISTSKLNPSQSEILVNLIKEYVQRHRPDVAEEDLKKIHHAGIEKISFAWAGGLERGEGHYYRIQGPTFLMEYDNTQNNNNHIHAVWRDFESDFGEDLLRQHYEQTPHNN
ncbi:MAG TPA: DUF3500 domain-containing protein [Candidatus Eisenbacteria bacterium]|nr:DUF3500 domain-containing protein [Candidatus Eisenbacteria bacterium]